ncbi:hypothetical protein JS608_00010 [Bacillus amyloliquefaciens]|nr:hypothetical protein JS608_00010 [Bacillus amyloliquefaciens]
MTRRMNAFDKAVAKGKSIRSLGSAARWCNAILAMAVAFKYPDKVSVASVIIGLMTIYPVIMIDSIISSNVHQWKRGENPLNHDYRTIDLFGLTFNLTNILMITVASVIVLLIAILTTRTLSIRPGKAQNFMEWIVDLSAIL